MNRLLLRSKKKIEELNSHLYESGNMEYVILRELIIHFLSITLLCVAHRKTNTQQPRQSSTSGMSSPYVTACLYHSSFRSGKPDFYRVKQSETGQS